jgi:hypothetical protein
MGLRLNWNGGIMGFERMGQWAIDISHSKMKELSKIIPLISTFQCSIIPLFHVRGKTKGLDKYF